MGEPQILQRWKNHLPHDIVLNILARLPVKSVTRFRCVCKFWNSSITTPYFISTHLNNSKSNDDNDYVIHMPTWEDRCHIATWEGRPLADTVAPSDTLVCTVALGRTFDRISEVRIPFDFDSEFAQIVDSFQLGFAYHSENDDYKVVRISHSQLRIHEIVSEVYTLSSDSWKKVVISLTIGIFFWHQNNYLPAPLVSGALHWVAQNRGVGGRVILSFDVNSETLRKLALPKYSTHASPWIGLFKGKLALSTWEYNYGNSDFRYCIWMMEEYGVVESWNKLFVIGSFKQNIHWSAFTMYGSLILCFVNHRVERTGFEFVLIDTETLHEKKDPDIRYPSYVATFKESLLLLDGANVVSY
ncbi:putative F-box protein At3g16210 [Quercus robur]|uniref:putative F-box protein At3g16210 n=1 Tax=Quercus robur TaxID=38942 RepID=UPI002163FCAB|nr:putative F-box protein At3g16210 [Quercus robur]